MSIPNILSNLWQQSGFAVCHWQNFVMIGIAIIFLVLAIKWKFEPLLLVPIAFGILLANLPGSQIMTDVTGGQLGSIGTAAVAGAHWYESGVLRIIYVGVKSSLFPCLIFLGVGAMTDFGPLLSNPTSLVLGAAAQLGIYMAFLIAILLGFTPQEAASIGIIGGADGPTAIFLTTKLAPHLLAPIAVAAYSYMALIPQSIYGHQFSDFHEIDERCRKLFSLSKTDGVAKCFCHGDCRDENFLINSESITLIDWEYSGYCDPGFDIGSYICGGEHSDEDIDDVLYLYFGRTPTFLERRHFLNYIALTGFFYMHWTMYKEYCGQEVGILKKYWHAYAARYSVIALQMYQKEKQ